MEMENRALGPLVIAGALSILMIAGAVAASRLPPPKPQTIVVEAPVSGAHEARALSDWKSALSAVGYEPASTSSYSAPTGLAPTDALGRELFSSYAEARQGGILDFTKANEAIADMVERRVHEGGAPAGFTLADLSIEADVSIAAYQASLTEALKGTDDVTEYELETFARAIEAQDLGGLVKLRAAGAAYRAVTEALVALSVPADIAGEHLSTVNSLAALADSVDRLGAWRGDPLDALAAVDAFRAAETSFARDFKALYSLAESLKKS